MVVHAAATHERRKPIPQKAPICRENGLGTGLVCMAEEEAAAGPVGAQRRRRQRQAAAAPGDTPGVVVEAASGNGVAGCCVGRQQGVGRGASIRFRQAATKTVFGRFGRINC